MSHEPEKPAPQPASPTPGTTAAANPAAPATRRELRLAEQRRAARHDADPAPVGAPERSTPPALTRRMLRAMHGLPAGEVAAGTGAATDAGAARWQGFVAASTPSDPTSRRELRLEEQAACPAPFALITAPAEGVDPTRDAVRSTLEAGPRPRANAHAKSVTAVALSAALLLSGFSLQRDAVAESAAQGAAQAAAQAAEVQRRHVARVDGAQTTRLTAQATAFAEGERAEALTAAAAAVATAEAVAATASPIVPDAVSPLDLAVDQLQALVGAAEQPTLAAPTAPTPEDELRAGAVERASRSLGGRPPVEADSGTPAGAASTDEVLAPLVPVAAVTDLEATGQMLAAAAHVTAMSAQVQAAAEAKIAEEAARAVAAAAAAELAGKVEVARSAANGDIPTEVLCAPAFEPGELMRCDAAAALEDLNLAYRAAFGRDLDVVSSYRSYSMQVSTRRSRGGLAATPGTSNHGRAVAVDFSGFGRLGSFRDPDYLWMKQNAAHYGWFHPTIMEPGGGGPQEPWHWEYGTDSGWDDPQG